MVDVQREVIINGTGLRNLDETAQAILAAAQDYRIWLFNGEMASGKTTLIKSICNKLGVEDRVSSPTFAIVNEYKNDVEFIYHFDFYRLKNLKEAIDIGIEEYFYSNCYCFVEWPKVAMSIIPQQYIKVNIIVGEGEIRTYKISYHGSN